MDDSARDDGQAAVVLVIMVATLFVALALALGSMGARTVDRTRAQTAADAAALASLDGGRPVAQRLATLHGGELVSWDRGPNASEVTVTVRFGDATATARATNAP